MPNLNWKYECNYSSYSNACNYVLLFQITEINHDVSFDPRVGFTVILHKITDSGQFVCKAIQGTTEQEMAFHIIVNRKCVVHQEHESSPQQ